MTSDEIKEKADRAFEQLAESLAAGKPEELTRYLKAMSRFHNYSFANQMLIAWQKPDATHVAGFHKWHEFGRHVKKGEKGIGIMAPFVGRKRKDTEVLDESPESQVFGFRTVFVFDVSQTEGEPLPTNGIKDAFGFVGDRLERLEKFAFDRGFAVEHVDDLHAEGSCSPTGIKIKAGKERADEFVTLVHEVAHSILHQGDARKERPTSKTVRETEAEAIAFIVATASGIEHPGAISYIGLYDGNADTLKASLQYIQQTAQTILNAIEPNESRNGQRVVIGATIHHTPTAAKPPPEKEPTI